MKKIAFLLALLLCLSAVSGLAAELKPANVVGTWYSASATNSRYGGDVLLLEPVRLDMNRDGTMALSFRGEALSGTWSLSGDKESICIKTEAGDLYDVEPDDEGALRVRINMFKDEPDSTALDCSISCEVTSASIGESNEAEEENTLYGVWAYDDMPVIEAEVLQPEDIAKLTGESARVTVEVVGWDSGTVMTDFVDGNPVSTNGDSLAPDDSGMLVAVRMRDMLIAVECDTFIFVRADEAAE